MSHDPHTMPCSITDDVMSDPEYEYPQTQEPDCMDAYREWRERESRDLYDTTPTTYEDATHGS